eukprot:TRINITY_DN3874_c0_g1_i1.p1 TRINITY_DN3874_c0_g1~~TRINITY_DN3874_c0_g1_i1.p1  ORF type:complete len:205 (+),score=38.76 TRINITY_DN3874_c0_g1_i1:111-725(+)
MWTLVTVVLYCVAVGLFLLLWDKLQKGNVKLAVLVLLALPLIDVPIARTRYNTCIDYKVRTVVGAYKDNLELVRIGLDPSDVDSRLEAAELAVCEGAEKASGQRQMCIFTVRDDHPVARYVAEIFDALRGVDQSTKVMKLNKTRSCSERLLSSTRSNTQANLIAATAGLFCIVIFCIALKDFIDHPWYNAPSEPPASSNDDKTE